MVGFSMTARESGRMQSCEKVAVVSAGSKIVEVNDCRELE